MENRKLKIAVFHNLPSGGAKRSLYGFIKALTNRNHLVDVFIPETANEDYLPLKTVATNVFEFEVQPSFFREKIYSIFDYVPAIIKRVSVSNVMNTEKQIAEMINKGEYDIVYCEQDQFTMTPVILKYLKKKTVYYCAQPIRKEKILKKVNDNKEKVGIFNSSLVKPFSNIYINHVEANDYERDLELAEYSTNILTNSYFTHEAILRQYGKNSEVCYIGVDIALFKPLHLKRQNFVLSVGTCIPPKGYDFLIKSISHIPKEERPELVITGNMSDTLWVNYLKNLAKEKEVDIDILSNITDEELLKLYNTAKLVVYAPYLEPFGYVPLEAMACGTPIVGVREGGIKESVIHKKTGLLTQRNEKDFANAIIQLTKDKKLWEKCSINGVSYIQSAWTIEKAGKRLENHLYRIIDE